MTCEEKRKALARLKSLKGTFPKSQEEKEAASRAYLLRLDQNLAAHEAHRLNQVRLRSVVLIGDLIDTAVDISTEKTRIEQNRLNHLASIAHLVPVPPIQSAPFSELHQYLRGGPGRTALNKIYLAHRDWSLPPPWINNPILNGHWESDEPESSKHGTQNHVWLAIW